MDEDSNHTSTPVTDDTASVEVDSSSQPDNIPKNTLDVEETTTGTTTTTSSQISLDESTIQQATAQLEETLDKLRQRNTTKLAVRFRAIGNAPIMKENRFQINASHRFHTVAVFLRKELRLKPHDPLFLYINSAFAPAPDEVMSNLHKCFSVDGQLIINYCITPAWG